MKTAIEAGSLHVLSPFDNTIRCTTAKTAATRNLHILTLSETVLFAHASPGGKTETLAREAKEAGLALQTLGSPANSNLVDLGAATID